MNTANGTNATNDATFAKDPDDLRVEIVRGPAADRLLADERFLAEWAELCAQCPWATGFQGPGFARAWYAVYRDQLEPVLVVSRAQGAAGGALQGLLALAFAAEPRRGLPAGALMPAGGIQAEYHAWVSTPPLGDAFPWRAVRALRGAFPSPPLTFHYLAPGAPTTWATGPGGGRYCVLRAHRRPLIRFGDGSDNAASLAKKSNKRRLKDLDKMGGLEFKRVTDPAEFASLFDEIVRLYDFRHGAVQGTGPFCTLERQKEFHVAMAKVPGLLHVTAMKVGGRLAAAHFGVVSGRELQLGTIVHDPALAKQSPGKFQILLMARMLIAEGFERLDLTPGGDTYKERFATDWDQVHTLSVLPTASRRTRVAVSARAKDSIKAALKRRGISTAEARHRLKTAAWELKHPSALAASLAGSIGGRLGARRETRVFWRPAGEISNEGPHAAAPSVRRDALDDLLAYRPHGAGQSRQAFLSAALSRVEEGQHAYTVVEGARLQFCAWLAERPSTEAQAALLPGLTVPPDSAILHGFQRCGPVTPTAPPAASPQSPSARLLRAMLCDAARAAGVRNVFLVVPDGDATSRELAESALQLGFVHDSSSIAETRFGRRHSRAEVVRAGAVSAPAPIPAEGTGPAGQDDSAGQADAAESSAPVTTPVTTPVTVPAAAVAAPAVASQDRWKRHPAPKGERLEPSMQSIPSMPTMTGEKL